MIVNAQNSMPKRWCLMTTGLIAFVFAWTATSPRWLTRINWDNGTYLAQCATGQLNWSLPPWNAHFAIGHVYYLGYRIVAWAGGTCVDGFRLATAVAFATAAVAASASALVLTQKILRSFMVALLWMTSWVIAFLLLTLEDNLLHLAPTMILLWFCLSRFDRWDWQSAATAGGLCASAALMSWQAMPYLWLPCAVPLFQIGPVQQRTRRTIVYGILVLVSFFVTATTYCLFVGAISDLTVKQLVISLFGRPTGNFSLSSPLDVSRALHVVGTAVCFLIHHTAYDLPAARFGYKPYGIGLLIVLFGLLVWSYRIWRTEFDRRPLFLAITLLIFVWIVPVYKDVTYRYLVRFDFIPAIVLLIVVRNIHHRPRWLKVVLCTLALIVQIALGLRWQQRTLALSDTLIDWPAIPHPATAFYGREGRSWFGYFRQLRQSHPDTKQFVFEIGEVWEGHWNFDVVGSLFSELPNVVVLSLKPVKPWRFPVKVLEAKEACHANLLQPDVYTSADAQRWLQRNCNEQAIEFADTRAGERR